MVEQRTGNRTLGTGVKSNEGRAKKEAVMTKFQNSVKILRQKNFLNKLCFSIGIGIDVYTIT